MKNRLKIVMTMTIALIASQVFGQVRIVNSATNSAAINGSAFIDASSNSTTNPTNNIGKGLLFPRTDLTTFSAFSGSPVGLGSSYPTRFDGMIVYNTGTGSTLASASDSIVSVTPGFYYYDNKTTNIKGGKWKRIDATTTDISKLCVQSPAKDSIINVISSNGKTLSNGNGILINGGNSLAKSVLADASLRIDSTAIAKMIMQSPVKDSISSAVTTLITSGSITGKTTTGGSLVTITNGAGAALKDNTVSVDTTALKTFISNNVNKSPIGDSIANSVTNLINSNKVAGKAVTGDGIIVTGGDSSVLKSTSLRLDSTKIAKFIGMSPVKDSITKLVTSSSVKDSIVKTLSTTQSFKDSITNIISANGKTLSNGNGILINGSNSLAKSVLADASLRIDSTAIAKMIVQSPVKDSVANSVTNLITSGAITGKATTGGSLVTITNGAGAALKDNTVSVDTTALKTFISNNVNKSPIGDSIANSVTNLINSNKVAGKAVTGDGIIVTGGDSSVLKSTSLRLDSTKIAKFIGMSPVKDSITKLVTSSSVKDSIVKTLSTTQSFKDSITNIISANGKTLSNGNGILINGSNSLAKSVLADASLRIDSTAIAKMIVQSPVKDSVANSVTNLITSGAITGKATTGGSLVTITNGAGAALKDNTVSVDTTALKTFISNNVNKSPIGDSIANSVTNLINSNKVAGKAVTGDGIIVTGGDSSVLKSTSLRLDSTKIAKFIGMSPVKDSITKLVTTSPVKDSIVKTLSTTQSFKDSITNIISANGKTLSNGNGILINGGNSLAKSVLADASLRIDSTAIAKMIMQSPVKDSIANSVTNLINSNKVAGKALTNGNGIIVIGGDSSVLKSTSLRIDSLAIAKFVGQSPMKDSLTTLINSTAPKTPDSTTSSNGLSMTGKDIRLGGTLTAATTLTMSATNTLALAGLQSGSVSDSVITWDASTSVLKKRTASSLASTLPFKTITSSYTVGVDDYTINCNYSAAGSLTLPSASANTGRMLRILVQNAEVTFLPSLKDGSITVSSMHSGTLVSNGITQDNKVTIQSDGTDWWIVGN